ncbi:MAG: hypothetical protein PHS93_09135, partial [Candidatus Omnitrophica bacterium]|nr:hypothetical protein [Candidatus Omnitrophota bacterium]
MAQLEDCDRYVWLNTDDRLLWPIKIDILDLIQRTYKDFGLTPPKTFPAIKNMVNYGKSKENQFFHREEYPVRLRDLETEVRNRFRNEKTGIDRKEQNIINTFWEELANREDIFKEEIEWLRLIWRYRLLGYWFLNNGHPTYMTGTNWFYCNFWYLDDILPQYRDCDRRWFIGQRHFQLDTTTFKDIDPKTRLPLQNVRGEYEMIDIGRKVFVGTNNTKSRRYGHTSKAQCDNKEYTTRTVEANDGIQGKDGDNAENVFKNHFVKPFRKLPIIFKPLANAVFPSEEMSFETDNINDGLNSKCNYAASQFRGAYDGYKLKRLHVDEPGKTTGEDVNKRHGVIRRCLSLGAEIIGFTQYITTVDEMDRASGENFLKLSKGSHYERRGDNGQTSTGLVNIFMRASDGFHGFVDKFGMSVEFDPTPEQAKYIGREIGARQYLENERMQLIRENRIEDLIEHKRQFPLTWAEVFTPPARNSFFRMDILENRIASLQHEHEQTIRGNFYHKTGDPDSDVVWQDDEENGKFYISKSFEPGEINRKIREGGTFRPTNPDRYVASADTFRVEKTEGGRMSDGAGVVRWKYDPLIDPPDKDVREYVTARAVITYCHRPATLDEYGEDMLMMCVYTGSLMYPEANIDFIEKYFIRRGYAGYLLYDTDWNTGRPRAYAGFYSHIDVKKKMFNLMANDIAVHGHRNRHKDVLTECMSIKSIDEMTDYDLFTAYAG